MMIDQVCDHLCSNVDDTLRLDGKVAKKCWSNHFSCSQKNLPSKSLRSPFWVNCQMNFPRACILSADRILRAHLYVGNSCKQWMENEKMRRLLVFFFILAATTTNIHVPFDPECRCLISSPGQYRHSTHCIPFFVTEIRPVLVQFLWHSKRLFRDWVPQNGTWNGDCFCHDGWGP